jgi:hypothetical protein
MRIRKKRAAMPAKTPRMIPTMAPADNPLLPEVSEGLTLKFCGLQHVSLLLALQNATAMLASAGLTPKPRKKF